MRSEPRYMFRTKFGSLKFAISIPKRIMLQFNLRYTSGYAVLATNYEMIHEIQCEIRHFLSNFYTELNNVLPLSIILRKS